MDKTNGFKIQEEERQGWISIAMVWTGSVICVPALMIGGMLGAGLTLTECFFAILVGYGMVCVLMCFIGMLACDTGLPTAVAASKALGESGAKYIISLILAISCIGWFGIQAAVCGESFYFNPFLFLFFSYGSITQLVQVFFDGVVCVEEKVEQHFQVFFQFSFVG